MGIRVTQTAAEALVQPTTQRVRITQAAIETLVQPTTQQVRVTQVAIEVLVPSVEATPRFWAQVIG